MRRAPLVALALGVLASPVSAGWQYTQWGMTAEDVVSASGGAAIQEDDPKKHNMGPAIAELRAPHASGQFTFVARFLFTSGRLSRVNLELSDPARCGALGEVLLQKYGRPIDEGSGSTSTRKWTDEENDNNVLWMKIGPLGCYVFYWQLRNDDAKGL